MRREGPSLGLRRERMSYTQLSILRIALFSTVAALAPSAFAAGASLTGGPYTQDFNTLVSSGTSATLPAGWAILETGTSGAVNGQYTAGTGSGTAGDVYSFGA